MTPRSVVIEEIAPAESVMVLEKPTRIDQLADRLYAFMKESQEWRAAHEAAEAATRRERERWETERRWLIGLVVSLGIAFAGLIGFMIRR